MAIDFKFEIQRLMQGQDFDCLALGIIDFKKSTIESYEYIKGEFSDSPFTYFDLASISKPLNLASVYLKYPEYFSDDMKLLLDHRGGLKAWGRLGSDWKSQIESYLIKESSTVYSDFSALRLFLEIEKVSKKDLKTISNYFWHKELKHWLDLDESIPCVITGMRNGKDICRQVHDDNAFVINQFCSHAGMFGTITGICESLLDLDKSTNMIDKIAQGFESKKGRFLNGFDTISDFENSLAGKGAGPKTFGHLGFSGTSFWIDCDKQRGSVILTNGTLKYWYAREGLRKLRRELGQKIWSL